MVHVGGVRQKATVAHVEPSSVAPGQQARARIRLVKQREHIRVGAPILLLGNQSKCIGSVVAALDDVCTFES